MKQAIHLKISGTVQGVFFRQSTLQKARGLGITGWVRNCGDGTVELVAEGEEESLADFIRWCHHGPQHAAVSAVETKKTELKNYTGFEIKR
jgi:acylphosphatase